MKSRLPGPAPRPAFPCLATGLATRAPPAGRQAPTARLPALPGLAHVSGRARLPLQERSGHQQPRGHRPRRCQGRGGEPAQARQLPVAGHPVLFLPLVPCQHRGLRLLHHGELGVPPGVVAGEWRPTTSQSPPPIPTTTTCLSAWRLSCTLSPQTSNPNLAACSAPWAHPSPRRTAFLQCALRTHALQHP